MGVAASIGVLLAWWLTARPAPTPMEPAPLPDRLEPAPDTPEPAQDAPPPAARAEGRKAPGQACRIPRVFEPSPKPWLLTEEEPGGERWYLRCPRPMGGRDGAVTALVRFQDPDGRTGLALQGAGGLEAGAGLAPVLEVDELASVDADILGCAALDPAAPQRAWVSVQHPDRSRVIHALAWQDGRLVLDGLEPVVEATEPWMKDRLWEPAVVRHGDTWFMYLRCGSRTRADLCVASSPDGERWSLEPERLLEGIEAGRGEVYGAPWAESDGERVHLWFSHKRYELDDDGVVTSMASEIHHLSSTDPRSFELRYRSVALAPGFADWAQGAVDTPALTRIEGRSALLFRGGVSAKDGVIGVAWGDCTTKQHLRPELNTKNLKSVRPPKEDAGAHD